jgi:hypothetical protein
MIFLFQALHICCASIIIVFSLAFANSETWTIPIDYAIKSLKFQRLGSINLRKQYDGNYTAEFDFETPEVIDLLQKNLLASKTDKKQPPDYILKCDNLFSSNYAVCLSHRILRLVELSLARFRFV